MQQVIRTTPRLHPLVAAAAVSVIVASVTGVAVITGQFPGSRQGAVAPAAPAAAVAAPPAVAPVPASPAPAAGEVAAAESGVTPPKPRRAAPVRKTAPEATPAASADLPVGRGESPAYAYGSYSGYGNAPIQITQAPAATPVPPPLPAAPPAPVARPACPTCGVVEAVVESARPGEASGVGMAGGALGGAVIGRQFGRGTGQDVLTVLGAIGGAVAGHQVEKQVRATRAYEVRVRMEDGSVRSVTQSSQPAWRPGDAVRVEGGVISAGSNV